MRRAEAGQTLRESLYGLPLRMTRLRNAACMDWCPQEGHLPDLTLRPVEHLQLSGFQKMKQTLTLTGQSLAYLRLIRSSLPLTEA